MMYTAIIVYLIMIAVLLYLKIGEMIARDLTSKYKLNALHVGLVIFLWFFTIPLAMLASTVTNIYYAMRDAYYKAKRKTS